MNNKFLPKLLQKSEVSVAKMNKNSTINKVTKPLFVLTWHLNVYHPNTVGAGFCCWHFVGKKQKSSGTTDLNHHSHHYCDDNKFVI